MNVLNRVMVFLMVLGLGTATDWSGNAFAQQIFIYPAQGQTPEKQGRDRYECHSWAVQQTGFDPSNPNRAVATQLTQPPPPAAEPRRGGLLRGGARGAALGAVGGAIAGDAGKGAAIGAATGALFGVMRRRSQLRRQQYSQRQYQAQAAQRQAQQGRAAAQQRNNYNRAIAACLQARGYSVTY